MNGVHIKNSDNCDLIENDITNNKMNGITLSHESGKLIKNTISNNTIRNNQVDGIYLYSNSSNNEILYNTINNNSRYGTLLYLDCDSNIISGNKIANNSQIGLVINASCADNSIYDNCFTGNTLHAQDNGSSNDWDNGVIGNYWDDYGGSDADSNNIGDTAYLIDGSAGSSDDYPLMSCGARPPPSTNGGAGSPGFIPGYDLIILLSVAIGISVLLRKKRLKQ
jgi:parallel beta-helix repeat protein